jgi:hypothetical protein
MPACFHLMILLMRAPHVGSGGENGIPTAPSISTAPTDRPTTRIAAVPRTSPPRTSVTAARAWARARTTDERSDGACQAVHSALIAMSTALTLLPATQTAPPGEDHERRTVCRQWPPGRSGFIAHSHSTLRLADPCAWSVPTNASVPPTPENGTRAAPRSHPFAPRPSGEALPARAQQRRRPRRPRAIRPPFRRARAVSLLATNIEDTSARFTPPPPERRLNARPGARRKGLPAGPHRYQPTAFASALSSTRSMVVIAMNRRTPFK